MLDYVGFSDEMPVTVENHINNICQIYDLAIRKKAKIILLPIKNDNPLSNELDEIKINL